MYLLPVRCVFNEQSIRRSVAAVRLPLSEPVAMYDKEIMYSSQVVWLIPVRMLFNIHLMNLLFSVRDEAEVLLRSGRIFRTVPDPDILDHRFMRCLSPVNGPN